MKKTYLLLLALAMLFAGCAKDEIRNEVGGYSNKFAPVFHAGFADNDKETKTFLNENGHLRWNADDRLTIFVGKTLNSQYAFDGEDGDNAGEFIQIGGSSFSTGNQLDANYAVYPYSKSTKISEEGVISLSLPATQNYGVNSFGRDANTMVSVTEDADDYYLPFKNVCGYLVIKLYGDATIASVSLSGNNGEKLAGAAKVVPSFNGNPSLEMQETATDMITIDCGEGVKLGTTKETATEFWFVVPQTTFTKGITITATLSYGIGFQKSTSNSVVVERNKISYMSALEYQENYGNVQFGDENFKTYCVENFDTDGDGEISGAEARSVINIDCSRRNISSLSGLEAFTSLVNLFCLYNQFTALDVSKNTALKTLYCGNNQLTELDVSKNTELTTLSCYFNQLTSLDISKNTKLTALYCNDNQLTSLDISNNTKLTRLFCSPMTTLETLYIFEGQSISGVTDNRDSDHIPDAVDIIAVDIP